MNLYTIKFYGLNFANKILKIYSLKDEILSKDSEQADSEIDDNFINIAKHEIHDIIRDFKERFSST